MNIETNAEDRDRAGKGNGTAIAAVVVILLLAIGLWSGWRFFVAAPWGPTAAKAGKSAVDEVQPPATSPVSTPREMAAYHSNLPPIHVGVLVSTATATKGGRDWRYEKQARIAHDARAPDIEMHAIIEPGTRHASGMDVIVQQYFSNRAAIECTDSAALKSMDVIVMVENWVADPQMGIAIDAAVSDGAGLLNYHGLGSMQPGVKVDDPTPARLAGLTDAKFGNVFKPVDCKVVADHPILGPLKMGDTLSLRPMGVFGSLPLDAIPLVEVVDNTPFQSAGKTDAIFYPLYISHLGKGKIISCQFARTTDNGNPPLSAKSPFGLYCIRWLAGREVDGSSAGQANK